MDIESLESDSGYFKFTSMAPVSDGTELVFHSCAPCFSTSSVSITQLFQVKL